MSMGRRARPRYLRVVAALAALLVTLVTLLAGMGVLPAGGESAAASERGAPGVTETATLTGARPLDPVQVPAAGALPDRSGTGKRVVFDISEQRVWLVEGDQDVRRTYLVSGSLTDNLSPGTYRVFSRSRYATGIDDSGEMEYFVRFTRGANAAIGFHSIPTKDGRALQTRAQLGTPQSHGCIRQAAADARRLWAFAPEGTQVVVTA